MNKELSALAKISSKPLEELSKEEMARLIIQIKKALLQSILDTSNLFLSISYDLKHLEKRAVTNIADTFFVTDIADIAANVSRETEKEKVKRIFKENKKKLSTMEEKLSELESEVKELLIDNRRALNALTRDNVDDNL